MIQPVGFTFSWKNTLFLLKLIDQACVGIRTDLNKDSKQPNLNPNQKAAQLQASCEFETSKLQSSTMFKAIKKAIIKKIIEPNQLLPLFVLSNRQKAGLKTT